ncbi:PREDICTED: cell surface glycoprotein CD200 receptor 1-B-like [Ficedula albicollis]|uniref:cell surface glycoprotein CD200 receptor 1-B-like n=1 Tax=Ficedula albicollis TaxID=59894 RepID=UPI0003593B87|nr:PREDICTED: cell surface glycoprotein CD200 receptor 1-B-like [Ficedula albicollis]
MLQRGTSSSQLHCGALRSRGRAVTLQEHCQGMLGASQQDGGCKKSFSPMKARATLKVVRMSICTVVLLIIAAVKGATGSNIVMIVGDSSVLTCLIKGQVSMLTWAITPKVGDPCTLVWIDRNMTHRANCSDNINLAFRSGLAPALEIQQVEIAQEGIYLCDVASTDGNFRRMYNLTVLAPPRLSLYCDEQGSPVCEAAVGKPPAQLSWGPESSSTAEEEHHDNRTVTVLSKFTACSTNVSNVTTCMVFHPAGNWSQSIACCPSEKSECFLHCVISFTSLTTLLFLMAAFQLYTFFSRTM